MVVLAWLCLSSTTWAQVSSKPVAQNTSQKPNKSGSQEENVASKYGVGRPMGDAYLAAMPVPADMSRLVVYRLPNSKQQSVMTVYINGSYHTSLMQAGFSEVCMDETNLNVRTRLRPVNEPVNVDLDKNVSLTIAKGQSQYVRVAELANGTTEMNVVTAQVAGNELKKTREQMHALSRVEGATPCEERKTAEVLDGIVLVAYLEFEEGRSRLSDMKPTDLLELDRLVDKLKAQSQNLSLMRLQVVGYANDGTKKTPSKQLAEQRAKTVEDYIVSQGVKPKTLKSEARPDKAAKTPTQKFNSVVVVSATVEQP
jgi:outer membrane protein OmpA-like peptidoglycan-associated protein